MLYYLAYRIRNDIEIISFETEQELNRFLMTVDDVIQVWIEGKKAA